MENGWKDMKMLADGIEYWTRRTEINIRARRGGWWVHTTGGVDGPR